MCISVKLNDCSGWALRLNWISMTELDIRNEFMKSCVVLSASYLLMVGYFS